MPVITTPTPNSTPFLVRRARLLLGMTQSEFGELFHVDVTTVSRWETGKLRPHPVFYKRIRYLAGANDDVVRASPVPKYVVPMNDLLHPCMISQGLEQSLKRIGINPRELFEGGTLKEHAHRAPLYPVSGCHALEMIEGDRRWLGGSVAYVEVHCVSVTLGNAWCHVLLAPIPDSNEAIMEWVIDTGPNAEEEGFWVHFVTLEELPKRIPRLH